MKKILAILLSLIFVLSLAACGTTSTGENKDGSNNSTADANGDGFYFTTPGGLKALGEPKSYTESASCAFEGKDKTYGYGGYYITTYPNGDKDYIYTAWFEDDSVTTAEGIYIGSTKADVEAAYGADCFDGDSALITKGNVELLIILVDGEVDSIQYQAIVN